MAPEYSSGLFSPWDTTHLQTDLCLKGLWLSETVTLNPFIPAPGVPPRPTFQSWLLSDPRTTTQVLPECLLSLPFTKHSWSGYTKQTTRLVLNTGTTSKNFLVEGPFINTTIFIHRNRLYQRNAHRTTKCGPCRTQTRSAWLKTLRLRYFSQYLRVLITILQKLLGKQITAYRKTEI